MNKIKRSFFFLIILTLFLIEVGYFLFNKLAVKAQGDNLLKIFPTHYSGNWQNPQAVFSQDLGPEASFEEFNQENSAFPFNNPLTHTNIKLKDTNNSWVINKNFFKGKTVLAEELSTENISTTTPFLELKKEIELVEKKLELSNFSLTSDWYEYKIQNVQLRFSFAAKPIDKETESKLKIEYYYLDSWQSLANFDLKNEISNELNGGYFLYVLPIFEKWEDLENLKIRFIYLGRENSFIFLDAAWLEVNYKKTEEMKEEITVLKKKIFRLDENPQFDLVLKGDESIILIDPRGQEIQKEITIQRNKIIIKQSEKRSIKPGLYRLKIKRGDQEIVQEFLWGVLAINTNKSIYLPNETAFIQMASLDESGHTLCDSNLKLEITTPGGELSSVPVEKSEECGPNNVTDKPDYFAYYQVNGTGIYQMKLTNLDSGYEIEDSFEVRESVPFDVERIGPTRIYPPATYEMRFKIKANQDFVGEIIEQIPSSFEIKSSMPNSRFQTLGASKQIIWDVDWQAGKVYELSYQFNAPDVSPYLYLLGPLELVGGSERQETIYEEARQWQIASDEVTNVGNLFYAQSATAGTIFFRTITWTDTFGAELTGPASSASHIFWLISQHSPTKSEQTIGHLKADGRLDVLRCFANGANDTSPCDDMTAGEADLVAEWNVTGVTATQTCDATAGSCWRAFDIAYEQLSGRAMVAYGKANTDGVIFYRIWDGASWSGELSYTFRSGSTYDTYWVRLIPYGDGLSSKRNNNILFLVMDASRSIFAAIWNGTSFTNLTTITTDTSVVHHQTFDGAWETASERALVVYAEGTTNSTTPLKYKRFIPGTGWDATGTTLPTAPVSTIGRWVKMSSDLSSPTSNRIAIIALISDATTITTNPRATTYQWDGSSMTAGSVWGSTETQVAPVLGAAWQKLTQRAIYVSSLAANADETGYVEWTTAGFSPTTPSDNISGDMADDAVSLELHACPNRDDIRLWGINYDKGLQHQRWSGSAWLTAWSASLATVPPGTANTNQEGRPTHMTWRPYSPWSRNWRWTDDITNQTPSSWLAAENTTPTNIPTTGKTLRLRFNFAELGGMNQTDARKRLQWATSTDGPWYDVDAQEGSGIWRYADCPAYSDDALIASTQLTGSTQAGPAWENGTAASSNGDHNALAVMEVEYCIQSNGAEGYTTYYFRAYDNDQQTPVFRQQTSNPATPCAGNTACSYPSLTTGVSNNPPTVSNVQLNGQNNITLNAGTTVSISATATVSDPDGYSDISNVQAKIYRSGVSGAQNCTQDDNNCYTVSSCSLDNCSGNSCDATCTISMWFHADPTDSGSPWASEYWRAWIQATDSQGASGENFSPVNAPDVNTLAAMELDLSSIGYGTVLPNQVSNQVAVKVTAIGNTAIDLQLSGTNLVWNSNSISVSQQKYSSINNFDYDTQGTALTTTPTCHELSIQKPTTHPSDQYEYVYWKLKVPTGKPAGGPYSGTNYFDVVTDSSCE